MQAAAGGMWAAVIVSVLVLTHVPTTTTRAGLWGCSSRMSAQPRGDATAQVIARAGQRIELGAGRVDVTLKPVESTADLVKRLDTLPRTAKVILALRELSADEAPATQFRVFFELPADRMPSDADPHEIGRVAFFNEIRAGREEAPTSARTYDVTSVLSTLQALGMIKDPLTVSIIPQRTPASNAKATVGEIELLIR